MFKKLLVLLLPLAVFAAVNGLAAEDADPGRLEAEERRILAELEDLERQIAAAVDRLVLLEQRTERTQERLVTGDRRLAELADELSAARDKLSVRLKALYKLDDGGLLRILLDAESVADLLRRYRYLNLILEKDREILGEYMDARRRLRAGQEKLRRDKNDLLGLHEELGAQLESLRLKKRRRAEILMRIQQEKELKTAHRQQQESSRRELLQKTAGEPPAPEWNKVRVRMDSEAETHGWPDFEELKGRIPRPVEGRVVGRYGGREGLTRHGVTFGVESGAEVRAVLSGEVIYAGWLRGYGNIIIINHGRRYYTLTGGPVGLTRRAGDWVDRGDVLGVIPKSGAEDQKEIYFEIRHRDRTLDPLDWLGRDAVA